MTEPAPPEDPQGLGRQLMRFLAWTDTLMDPAAAELRGVAFAALRALYRDLLTHGSAPSAGHATNRKPNTSWHAS